MIGESTESVDKRVLEVVTGFVAELGTTPARGVVKLDDSLARDLGIGSLERVELIVRLEQAFGTRLGDAVMTEAETCRDVVRMVAAAAPRQPARTLELVPPIEEGVAAPASARTLTEALAWHAERDPERVHVFLRADDESERAITYGELAREAARMAAALHERGLARGDRVSLMLRTEEAFFFTFFGVLLAGGVPVPIYPPFRADRLEEYAERQARILDNAQARFLVTFREAERLAGLLRTRVASLEDVIGVERLRHTGPASPVPGLDSSAAALIQYTSGSTGDPKGVLLSHANLLANIRALGDALAIRPDDVAVSWLPLYHDMGLIGAWLAPLYHAVPTVIFSPLAFLSRPARWLRTLHAHRGTLSPAPNFAFDLCVKRVTEDEIEGLDLRAWRLAMNGSEPVSPETIERFVDRFAPHGFQREAMCPVYGLAEASVGLTLTPPGRGPRIDRVARDVFTRSHVAAIAADDEPAPLRFVSCGRPLHGHDVLIVDEARRPLPDRIEGRVLFRGPSVTAGYFRNPRATRAALEDGWMDSGDLGYRADGELYITGRRKDVIIKAGRNLYPQEIEQLVGNVPGVRKGCVAAFGVADPEIGTERLIIVAESREPRPDRREALRAAVRDRVVTAVGIPPDTVVIAAPGSVLKTSSGKIRRSATREAYLGGSMSRRQRSSRAQWLALIARDVAARLDRLARGVARYGYAAYVGAVLAIATPVLWCLVILTPGRRGVDRLVRRWCRGVLTLARCRLTIEGLEHIPSDRGVVFAANHSSYVDVVALLAAIPTDFRFVAKKELLAAPLVGRVIRRVGHLTVDRVDLSRSVADAERVTGVLRSGTSLFFFPEGTFVRAPQLLPFKLGAFKAAVEVGCPIVPVSICGTRDVLPADTWLPRPGRITITVSAPIVPAEDEWREIVRVRDRTREEIAHPLAA